MNLVAAFLHFAAFPLTVFGQPVFDVSVAKVSLRPVLSVVARIVGSSDQGRPGWVAITRRTTEDRTVTRDSARRLSILALSPYRGVTW